MDEGISAWPSQFVRALAISVCTYFLLLSYYSVSVDEENYDKRYGITASQESTITPGDFFVRGAFLASIWRAAKKIGTHWWDARENHASAD